MEAKDVMYGLGIFATLVLGIWNLVSNWRLARHTNFINTVTGQRVKWIEQLRQDISAFAGLTYTWCFSKLEGKPAEQDALKEIDRLRHVIRLRLNPNGTNDKRIEELIQEIPNLTHESQTEQLKQALDNLVVVSQKLFKEEWEKVKQETRSAKLSA